MGFLDQVFGKKKPPALDKEPKPKPKPGLPLEPSPQEHLSQQSPASSTSKPPGVNIHLPGDRIAGRYEVASRPLMGGMGIVYLCYDHQADRPVALKTFRPEYLPDREARDRFLREGTVWVSLGKHPHIVCAYGVEYIGDGREVYLVLELVSKEKGHEDASLRSWLKPWKPLSVDQTILFTVQIVRALQHAAALIPGFVHRDLKPENVLVGADRLTSVDINRIRVTDFGLASVAPSSSPEILAFESSLEKPASRLRRTQLTRGIVGTPLYMAPEQWKGEGVSVQTDMYALGCIVYEMVAGQPAVNGSSVETLMQAHCRGDIRPLKNVASRHLAQFGQRCLALDPKGRYRNWEEVERALEIAYRSTTQKALPEIERTEKSGWAERVALGHSQDRIGLSYLDIGKAKVALGYFQRALEISTREGALRLEAVAQGNLGQAYLDLGEAQRAIGYFRQCLAIARSIGDPLAQASALNNVGNAYAALGDLQRGIIYHEECLDYYRKSGDRGGEGSALNNLGTAYEEMGDARRAIGYYEKALSIFREIGDRRMEGNAQLNLGLAYAALGDLRGAIGYCERALAVSREIGDRKREGNALGSLGRAHAASGDLQRAIGYYEQALAVSREIGDRNGEGVDLGNLGLAYVALGDSRLAIVYYEQALAIRRDIGDLGGMATDLFNMALVYARQGEQVRALSLAQESARLSTLMGHVGDAQQAHLLVAQLQSANQRGK
jgi:serine/threonine protein kinase